MASAPTLTGVIGKLMWAYYLAAGIHDYTVVRLDGATWTLVGRLGAADAYKLTQRPLTFVAPHQRGAWRWPVREITITADQVSATLGALEEVTR